MSEQQSRLSYLYERFISDKITPDELREFWQRIKEDGQDDSFINAMMNQYKEELPANLEEKKWKNAEEKIFDKKPRGILSSIRRAGWKAASIIILVGGLATYLLLHKTEKNEEHQVVQATTESKTDVEAPTTSYATITLANGEKIHLDSAGRGQLAMQDNVSIIKAADGSIRYGSEDGETATALRYNTLTNPRGSRVVSMILSDGSKVWLNAESSITYPVAFTGNERKVTVKGEAYFEVAHNSAKKFIVESKDVQTTVYGTHFNVNAYDDEDRVKVTLLEGSVGVSNKSGMSVMLKPGEQAEETTNRNLQTNRNIYPDDIVAWKDERFSFRVANIKNIMKEVARWYNVEIQYTGDISDLNFGGSMSRQNNVSELLKRLEATQEVKFEVIGKVITVIKK